MDPIEQDLIDGLAADRSLDRYLVYADYLQTRGDPRGELIALAVHERQTGTVDLRTRELQATCEGRLLAAFKRGVAIDWELGCVRGVQLASNVLPMLTDLLDDPAFALVRSVAIVESNHALDAWPVELIARSPFARVVERVAVGSRKVTVPTDAVDVLIERLPKLTGLEIRGNGVPEGRLLDRLDAMARLEELELWMTSNDDVHRRLIAGPWSNLRALTTTGHRDTPELPSYLSPLLDGTRHPNLVELSIYTERGIGFENALIEALVTKPLGTRLRRLGLHWWTVSEPTLEAARDALANVELVWPRPTGSGLSGGQHYSFARCLRLGMERNRLATEQARLSTVKAPAEYYHWLEYGYALRTLDRLPETIEAMDHAIKLERKRWAARAGRAAALRDLSRYVEAQAELDIALGFEPDRVQLHNSLGILCARRGHGGRALRAFDRAAELATTSADRASYACNAIEIEIEEGRLAEARERWQQAMAYAPDHARLRRVGGYLDVYAGSPASVLGWTASLTDTPPTDDLYTTFALHAAALRSSDREAAGRIYQQIVDHTDCPAYVAFAWLGQTVAGTGDPFAAIATRDPRELADAIAMAANAVRGTGRRVHTTEDRCDDRIHSAVCATIAACAANRPADARQLADALAEFLDGPAPVKHNDWWLELAELVEQAVGHAVTRDLAELARRAYRVATGREKPSLLAAPILDSDVRPDS